MIRDNQEQEVEVTQSHDQSMIAQHITNNCATAYVDAYVKGTSFGGHVYVTDTLHECVEQWSIGANN